MSHRQRRNALVEGLLVAGLMLLPLLFWWRLWALDPADRAVIPPGDFTSQYYPLHLFGARELAAGRLPAWNPYINAGQPGLADIQTGFFYPFNLLPDLALALSGLSFGLGLLTAQVIFHFSLASLFTYVFVRHRARRVGSSLAAARFAGAVSAIAFTYAGYLTSFPVQQITILETAVWLPLILLFLDRAAERTQPLSQLVLAGLALACALLAGHPQTALYVIYAVFAYGLFLVWSRRDKHVRSGAGSPSRSRRLAAGLALAAYWVLLPIVLAVLLTAIQLVPTLQFIAHSTRTGLDYQAVSWGFPLAEVTHLLYPGYFGGSPQYVGILPLVLAVAALLVKRSRREVVFWTVVAVAAFLLAFGRHTFLYSLAYLGLPGFGAVRDQERIIYLFGFAISVLAGYGALTLVQPVHRLVRRGFRRFGRALIWLWLAFIALTALFYFGYLQGQQQGVEVNLFEGLLRHHVLVLFILGGSALLFAARLAGRARRGVSMALALGLIWLNLFTVNWQYNLAQPLPGGPFPETGIVRFLKAQTGTYRISSAGWLPGGASAGIVYQIEDITGNTPLRLDHFEVFEEQVESWRRWQLLNVRYVLSQEDLDGPGLVRVYEEGATKIYQVGDPLPRAWLVSEVVVASDTRALEMLNAEGFSPRTTAISPRTVEGLGPGDAATPPGTVQVVEARPGRLILDVSATREALLVISQPFYPGWRARVDGAERPIHRVDYFLQAVTVAAGSQRVEIRYHVPLLPGILSGLTLLACLAVMALKRKSEPGEAFANASL
ncbi:MAG: YfhO family protein [Anaerolineae bacterium]|nr:YfhO family protein [Anaerolineae bacterium]